MADLSKLSNEDLQHLKNGAYDKVSNEGLKILSGTQESPSLTRQAWEATKSGAKTGIEGLLRAADYAGGISRTALAGLADIPAHAGLTDQYVSESGDIQRALEGRAPTTEEYLGRVGALENLPITRKTISLAGDILTDPLNVATMGATGATKALLKPMAKTAEKIGPKIYQSGLKKLDLEAYKQGKEPVSATLMKYDVAGSPKKVYEKMGQIGETLLERQKTILENASQAGAKVDMQKAMTPVYDYINKLRASGDPLTQPIATALETQASQYIPLSASPTQASGMKTSLYRSITPGPFMEAVTTAPGKLGQKKMASGLKAETESAVSRSLGPDEAANLIKTNQELGQILGTRGKELGEVGKEEMKNLFTSVDAPLLGYAATSGGPTGWTMLALKKAADVAKMTGTRTRTGRALKNYGASDISTIPDVLLRRELIGEQ